MKKPAELNKDALEGFSINPIRVAFADFVRKKMPLFFKSP